MDDKCELCETAPATMAVLMNDAPVLSAVPACQECADKTGLPAVPIMGRG